MSMLRHHLPAAAAALAGLLLTPFLQAAAAPARPADRPNIILFMVDDLGYGDVGAYNPNSKIRTPNMDRLASQGMRFTDAHTAAGVCTPARYAALAGRYSFRTRLQARILGGYDPTLFEPGRLTVQSMLQQQGYTTAAIGKWHLGMTYPRKEGVAAPADVTKGPAPADVDFTKPVTGGPNALGFDYFYGIPSSIDIAPYVFMENDRFLQQATTQLTSTFGRTGFNSGLAAPDFNHVDVMPAVTAKAREYLAARAKEPAKPFFLFFAATGVHNPIVPAPEFAGKSAAGDYGDFVEQVDASLGQLLDALKENGLERDTLVIFTSDNGPAQLTDSMRAQYGHFSAGDWRGGKASLYEGGHRLPFIASWPAVIKAGAKADAVVGLTDLVATCAEITGFKLPDAAAEDSFSLLPILKDPAGARSVRRTLVIQADAATDLALRVGSLKLITSARAEPQLYDLAADPKETKDLAKERPDTVKEMAAQLEKIRADGRETPHR
jgi:arylsulfatase A